MTFQNDKKKKILISYVILLCTHLELQSCYTKNALGSDFLFVWSTRGDWNNYWVIKYVMKIILYKATLLFQTVKTLVHNKPGMCYFNVKTMRNRKYHNMMPIRQIFKINLPEIWMVPPEKYPGESIFHPYHLNG